MNTNTNLSFLQSHSFPFFNREVSDSFTGSSLKKSVFNSSTSRSNLRSKYFQKKNLEQTKQCCKRFFTFLFSHIGLSAVLVGYVIIGGLMFQSMEVAEEISIKHAVIKNRSLFIKDIIQQLKTLPGVLVTKHHFNNSNFKYKNQTGVLEEYLRIMIVNYTKHIIYFMQEQGWNGNDDDKNLKWSYEGAVLYVITVITTIGYGHVAPKTNSGKFMTMLYALLGIPLTFLYLSNIGDYLSDWFRFFYHKICRKYCKFCCRRQIRHHSALRHKVRKTNALPGLMSQNFKRDKDKQNLKPNSFIDKSIKHLRKKLINFPMKSKTCDEENSSQFQQEIGDSQSIINSQNDHYVLKSYGVARFLPSIKTVRQREALMMNCVSTNVPLINWRDIDKDLEIGSLENIPNTYENHRTISEIDFPFSDPDAYQNDTSTTVTELQISKSFTKGKSNYICKSLPYLSSLTDCSIKNSSIPFRSSSYTPDINFVQESVRQVSYVSVNNAVEVENEKKINSRKNVKLKLATVPISLSLAVIWIYIIFGSVIFTMWEDSDYLKWSYFCFITLSTIGFGDIVPGTKVDTNNPKEKLVLVSVYVVIGLSVFAMCFKLMQEEVIAKFKRLARKFGSWKNKMKSNKPRGNLVN